MGLLDRLTGRMPAELQQRLDEHQARGGEIVRRIREEYQAGLFAGRASATPAGQTLKGDDELALSVFVAAVAGEDYLIDELQATLGRRRLPYERVDLDVLIALAERRTKGVDWRHLARTRAAVAAVERYARDHGVEEISDRVEHLKRLIGREGASSDWTSLGVRLRKLVPDTATLDISMLLSDDPWAKRARPIVEREFRDQGALLTLLGAATASRPTKKWTEEVRPLLAGPGEVLVRTLLEVARDVESRELGRLRIEGRVYVDMQWLTDPSATVVRGCLWAASIIEDDAWVVEVANALLERAMREEQIKVANAALYALGEASSEGAVAVLARLAARVKDRRFTKGIDRALDAAAGRRGITRAQLRESLVPTHGLAADGTSETRIGNVVATIELVPPASVATRWTGAGDQPSKTPPAGVRERHAEEVSALKARVAEIRKELGVQRLRVEGLLADDRTWTFDDWRQHYLDHPLVQLFTRRLIWRFDDLTAIPIDRERYLTAEGSAVEPPSAGEVRLWHPIFESAEVVAEWRRLIRERELVQPFKQAFREVYYVAPAEETTGTYSNRFAAHIVRYPQVYALMKQRGWGVVALGPYDNDGGRQWRDFDEQGMRAEFWMEHADENWDGINMIANLASTDQVRFYRLGENEPLPVASVPPIVFSEAMRDVDLFVGVASVAADPNWLDAGPERFHAYWRETSFGELTESGVVRRDLLGELLPSLRIADRCSLDDRYLVVRGKLRTYRIHLGSANVLMEPNDQYLCIVPAKGKGAKLFLPFPEDERFSVILSKAFLLADDDRIKDPSIVAQIRR
jgi:hypothetical protein